MVEIWFIRHGESVGNAGGRTKDAASIPLTPKGHAEAKTVSLLIETTPALIITSPYLRTQETAQPTFDRFPDVPHETWDIQEFNYMSGRKYNNTTVEERAPMRDAFWQKMDPSYDDGDDSESFSALISRARDTLNHLQQQKEGPIIVFSHGMFMHALRRVIEAPDATDRELMQDFLTRYYNDPIHNTRIIKAAASPSSITLEKPINDNTAQTPRPIPD